MTVNLAVTTEAPKPVSKTYSFKQLIVYSVLLVAVLAGLPLYFNLANIPWETASDITKTVFQWGIAGIVTQVGLLTGGRQGVTLIKWVAPYALDLILKYQEKKLEQAEVTSKAPPAPPVIIATPPAAPTPFSPELVQTADPFDAPVAFEDDEPPAPSVAEREQAELLEKLRAAGINIAADKLGIDPALTQAFSTLKGYV